MIRFGEPAVDRAGEHHAAARAGLDPPPGDGLREEERRRDVQLHRAREERRVDVEEAVMRLEAAARVVHEQVDVWARGERVGRKLLRGLDGAFREIGGQQLNAYAGGATGGDGLARVVVVAQAMEHDVGARSRERDGDGPADALSAARHEGGVSAKVHGPGSYSVRGRA